MPIHIFHIIHGVPAFLNIFQLVVGLGTGDWLLGLGLHGWFFGLKKPLVSLGSLEGGG